MKRQLFALTLASFLSLHGLRKKSLSPSGALAALTIGFTMMSAPLSAFGASLITFYLVGSRATKLGAKVKNEREDGHVEGGNRSGWQVLCNSGAAGVACVVWTAMFGEGKGVGEGVRAALPAAWAMYGMPYKGDEWCPISSTPGDGWSRFLLLATLG